MTNNNPLTPDLIAAIDERVQGRDIEKYFDRMIENTTDAVIDSLMLTDDQLGDELEVIDYISTAVMKRFNYHFVDPLA